VPQPDPPASAAELADRLRGELLALDGELSEVELLLQQARAEASRQETRRAAAADKVGALGPHATASDVADVNRQLVTVTRRAAVMQSQVDVLEGKVKVLQRFRDATARVTGDVDALLAGDAAVATGTGGAEGVAAKGGGRGRGSTAAGGSDADAEAGDVLPPAVSRIVLGAQEDLRREIARTMHDGPAQSLTNIVLQAQIVERLLTRDPAIAAAEVRQLVAMVQQTLDATKSFIFDVRPMVLDDLGLVPTIRRAARERGRRAQIPVEFESFGTDRRLPMELESGLFRILDEALAAYLSTRPERITIRLDWADGLEARIESHRAAGPDEGAPAPVAAAKPAPADTGRGRGRGKPAPVAPATPEAVPAALQAMIDDRRAAETAARRVVGGLPAATRREIRQRAATLGVEVELREDGQELRLTVEAPAAVA
jgi:two-component system sensor histidine kinase DegS